MPPKTEEVNNAFEPNAASLDGEAVQADYMPPLPPGSEAAPDPEPPATEAYAAAQNGAHSADKTAGLIAATILMQKEHKKTADPNEVSELAEKLMEQPAFRRLAEDPKTLKLTRDGNGIGLIQLMASKELERKKELERYLRPEADLEEDGLFLNNALDSIRKKDGSAASGAAGINRKGRLYQEMVRQIEHAETMAQQGIQMSGEDCKKLIDAVKKYNDSGSKIPGGLKKAAASDEAMCILKRYMPEEEFQAYCSGINVRRKTKIDPESFTAERINGSMKSVKELQKECRLNLQKNFTMENCAALVACSVTPAKNGLIKTEEYEKQKVRLTANGSAFKKALQDEGVKKQVTQIVKNGGKSSQIVSAVRKGAMNHAGRAAQWQLDRSKAALKNEKISPDLAGEHLANIMAVHQFSKSAGIQDQLTNKAFAERAQEIKKDPAFTRIADRYARDPDYRSYLKKKVDRDGTGASLADEYGRVQRTMRKPVREEKAPQAGL